VPSLSHPGVAESRTAAPLQLTDARSNGHRELGGTAANTPLVAWHHHDHGPMKGVDYGPWRAAVDGGPGRALGLALAAWCRVPVLLSAQGGYHRDQAACGRGKGREVVDSLEAQRVRTKASLSQVINGLKAAAKAREGGN
jgi:hypothetical protein